jgi:hypothetical protein
MAASLAVLLIWAARGEWMNAEGRLFRDYEDPLTEDTDLANYSFHSVNAAADAFMKAEQLGTTSFVEGPITDPHDLGIDPATTPPYIPGVQISSFTEGWYGERNSLLDGQTHTVWATTNIPSMIEFDLAGYYRVESFEITNGYPSGAARVRMYAWGGRNWLRVSLNELISGEVKVTPVHPVFTAKIRISFHTYHMGGVNVSDVKFRGLASRAVMAAMSRYQSPEHAEQVRALMRQMDEPLTKPQDCPVLQRFPNPSIFELAMWAAREKGCMCAHELTEVLREPTEAERKQMQFIRKGFVIAKGMKASPFQMYHYVNKSLENITALGPPPELSLRKLNASYNTPFIPGRHGEGIVVHSLSLAQLGSLSQEQLLKVTVGQLGASVPHLQSYIETYDKSGPEPLMADAKETLQAQLESGVDVGLDQKEPAQIPEPPEDDEDPTKPIDPEATVTEHADGSVTASTDDHQIETVRDLRVVCLGLGCMLNAMQHTTAGCQKLLKPVCEQYVAMTGCPVECDWTETLAWPDDGCLKLHRPLGDVGYSYDDMAKAANHVAEKAFKKSNGTHFDYKKYLSDQGYEDYAPKAMREQERLKKEMKMFQEAEEVRLAKEAEKKNQAL